MAMISCKECGAEISDTAKVCPKCGFKLPRTKWWLWVPLGLIVVFFGVGLLGPSSGGSEKHAARQNIDRCWDEQKRKSYSPALGG